LIKEIRGYRQTGANLPFELCENEFMISNDEITRSSQIRQITTILESSTKESPNLVTLLSNVREFGLRGEVTFDPEHGVDAAICSQKPSKKLEYIRAFGYLLTSENSVASGNCLRFVPIDSEDVTDAINRAALQKQVDNPVPLTARVQRSMGITASVVLDIDVSDDNDVSDDDVRKALRFSEDKSANTRRNLPKQRKN